MYSNIIHVYLFDMYVFYSYYSYSSYDMKIFELTWKRLISILIDNNT